MKQCQSPQRTQLHRTSHCTGTERLQVTNSKNRQLVNRQTAPYLYQALLRLCLLSFTHLLHCLLTRLVLPLLLNVAALLLVKDPSHHLRDDPHLPSQTDCQHLLSSFQLDGHHLAHQVYGSLLFNTSLLRLHPQPQSSRALFTSKPYSPPRSPTLSPHRPITSLPCSPPQPTISPTLPSHGVNRHPPTVTTTPPHWSHPPTITTTPSPWSHPPTITPTPQSHSHPPSPGFNRSRDRHVKLAAVWSNSSGGSPQQQQHSPMRGLLSNITSPGANKVM